MGPVEGIDTPLLDPEIVHEHIRKMLASQLYLQEREASADLPQVYHSNEESLLPGSQSILTSTERPVALLSQERRSSQVLDNDTICILLDDQKERLRTEAKSKILRHEYRADLAENSIRASNRQIEFQAMDTLTGHE